jgi:cation diffusion facilitator CzcD-associated flavoprotein CzcO
VLPSSLRIPAIAILIAAAVPATASARQYPETIPLPNGWQPEGIATGFGDQFFAGSRATGGVFKGNLRTGEGDVLVPGFGGAATGMKVDRRNRLFVSGAQTGTARVYNAATGKLLREYDLTDAPTFVNDVTLTKRAAYFTDSQQKQLYMLRLRRHGGLPARARTLPLTGDLQYDDDANTFELNGIAAAGRKRLITVQSRTGKLFLVNARTGGTREIDLGDGSVPNGDGILLKGRTLYVVQNQDNQVAVVHLRRNLRRGEIKRHLTDDDFDVPTTIARRGRFLWAVNARFSTPPTPDTTYDVVRVSR